MLAPHCTARWIGMVFPFLSIHDSTFLSRIPSFRIREGVLGFYTLLCFVINYHSAGNLAGYIPVQYCNAGARLWQSSRAESASLSWGCHDSTYKGWNFSDQGVGGTSLVKVDWMAIKYPRGSTKNPAFLQPPGDFSGQLAPPSIIHSILSRKNRRCRNHSVITSTL